MCAKQLTCENLESCCQSFEHTFSLAAEISKLLGDTKCLKTTAKKTLCYNPSNNNIQKLSPELFRHPMQKAIFWQIIQNSTVK